MLPPEIYCDIATFVDFKTSCTLALMSSCTCDIFISKFGLERQKQMFALLEELGNCAKKVKDAGLEQEAEEKLKLWISEFKNMAAHMSHTVPPHQLSDGQDLDGMATGNGILDGIIDLEPFPGTSMADLRFFGEDGNDDRLDVAAQGVGNLSLHQHLVDQSLKRMVSEQDSEHGESSSTREPDGKDGNADESDITTKGLQDLPLNQLLEDQVLEGTASDQSSEDESIELESLSLTPEANDKDGIDDGLDIAAQGESASTAAEDEDVNNDDDEPSPLAPRIRKATHVMTPEQSEEEKKKKSYGITKLGNC
uniref:Uncharacterized protein n=1 Tax=Ditylenchus dipsaci TaxID=166011 RepID=A0A915EAY7_9BILA